MTAPRQRDFAMKLHEQLEFIDFSCQNYDRGKTSEAVRIAAALRIIFYDTPKSTSLLRHLGIMGNIKLLSTAEGLAENGTYHLTGLTFLSFSLIDDNHRYDPMLHEAMIRNLVDFDQWWLKDSIFLIGPSRKVNRRQLVRDVANKDGGAHIDATLSEAHEILLDGAGSLAETQDGKQVLIETPKHAAEATLRQIGWEVLHSPDLLRLADMPVPEITLTGTP